MEDKARAHAIITGIVQGVFFRMETQRAAERHNVTGWVRNKRDGSVEAVFEGERAEVNAALDWCRQGPARAVVHDIPGSTGGLTSPTRSNTGRHTGKVPPAAPQPYRLALAFRSTVFNPLRTQKPGIRKDSGFLFYRLHCVAQLFTGRELDRIAGFDLDGFTCLGIAPLTGFAAYF